MDSIVISPEPREQTFDWGRLTWFAEGAQNNSDFITVGRCILNPGCGNPRHRHPNCEEVLVVLQGKIRHTSADGQMKEMSVGQTVTIPANIWHHAENIGDEEAVLMIAFSSPERQTEGEV